MQIICKLANLHIHEYVNYSNSVVKYKIIFILFFFIINVCVLKKFKPFIVITFNKNFFFWFLIINLHFDTNFRKEGSKNFHFPQLLDFRAVL